MIQYQRVLTFHKVLLLSVLLLEFFLCVDHVLAQDNVNGAHLVQQPQHQVYCTRGDYSTSHWESHPTGKVSVPMIPYNWKEVNPHLPDLFFNDKKGYQFCGNSAKENGKTRIHLQRPGILTRTYVPGAEGAGCIYQDFNRSAIQYCLRNRWIHMDGDSVMRDTYYDILEAVGLLRSSCTRVKKHQDLLYKGIYRLMTMDMKNYLKEYAGLQVSLAFNPAEEKGCDPTVGWHHPEMPPHNMSQVPDYWIWSPGLWFIHEGQPDSREEFTRRLHCVGEMGRQNPSITTILRLRTAYAEKEERPPAVTVGISTDASAAAGRVQGEHIHGNNNKGINRPQDDASKQAFVAVTNITDSNKNTASDSSSSSSSSPLSPPPPAFVPRRDVPWSEWINAESVRVLHGEYGWRVLDVYKLTLLAPELTTDGVHYTGKGSHTMTNMILNMICNSNNNSSNNNNI